jgi:hypothetical protein
MVENMFFTLVPMHQDSSHSFITVYMVRLINFGQLGCTYCLSALTHHLNPH